MQVDAQPDETGVPAPERTRLEGSPPLLARSSTVHHLDSHRELPTRPASGVLSEGDWLDRPDQAEQVVRLCLVKI